MAHFSKLCHSTNNGTVVKTTPETQGVKKEIIDRIEKIAAPTLQTIAENQEEPVLYGRDQNVDSATRRDSMSRKGLALIKEKQGKLALLKKKIIIRNTEGNEIVRKIPMGENRTQIVTLIKTVIIRSIGVNAIVRKILTGRKCTRIVTLISKEEKEANRLM